MIIDWTTDDTAQQATQWSSGVYTWSGAVESTVLTVDDSWTPDAVARVWYPDGELRTWVPDIGTRGDPLLLRLLSTEAGVTMQYEDDVDIELEAE